MHKLFSLVILLCCLLTSNHIFAGKEKMNSRINSAQISVGGFVAAADDKFPNISLSGGAVVINSTAKLTLGLDNYAQTLNYFGMSSFYLKVGVNVVYSTTSGNVFNQTVDLVINHNNLSSAVNVDKSISVFKNAHVLAATIAYFKDASNNIITSPFIPSNLYLEAEVETERIYPLNPLDIPEAFHYFDNSTNELKVYWKPVTGAEEYELEWTYVNNYDISSTAYIYDPTFVNPTIPSVIQTTGQSNLEFTFLNNATRIRTSNNEFNIGLNYDRGLLVYRIRAIGKNITSPSFETIGNWSLDQPNTIASLMLSSLPSTFDDYYIVSTPHEENKNWQYSANYAEDGKKKEVVGYFDGSMRKRQTVTKSNTENIALIGETFYDSQGRPAIDALPGPTIDYAKKIGYFENFNQSNSTSNMIGGFHVPYSKTDFESSTSCPSPAGPMFTGNLSSGANGSAVYYSANNQNKENQQAYLPNSLQFPFSSKIYTPDHTGRIKYQSGVGPDHQIGTNHETKYLYGDPDQEDLDMLFGSEAGFAEKYKKNSVIDANGQISVSYLNTENKVVATALAGDKPANVNSLNSTTLKNKSVSYMDYADANYDVVNYVENGSLVFKKKIIPDYSQTYNFTYQLTLPQFTDNCITACYDCIYDLEIKIKNECNAVIYSTVTPVGFNSGNTVDFICGSPLSITSNNWNPVFSAYLLSGKEYYLTKTLTVNKNALSDYLNHYINKNNNTCVKELSDFVTEENLQVDTSGCNMTCASCVTQVNNYYSQHNDATKADPNHNNYDPDYIFMSVAQFNLAIEACNAPCKPATLCQVEFENMLQDVKPKGQYAQYDINTSGVYDASAYELSIFRSGNYLRITTIGGSTSSGMVNPDNQTAGVPFLSSGVDYSMQNEATWKYPELYNSANHNFSSPTSTYSKYHYFNADGTIGKVRLLPNGTGYLPAIVNTSLVFTDNLGKWTYPENLLYLKDFITAYSSNPFWAYSLVKYHPEFNYFLDCDRQGNSAFAYTYGSSQITSEGFDTHLRETSTHASAITPFSPGTGKWFTITTNDNTVSFTTPGDLVDFDPYFNGIGAGVPLKSAFIARLNNYQGTGKTVKEIAGAMYSTANIYYMPSCSALFGATSITCGSTNLTIPTASLDEEWKAYREMYLAEKQKIILEEAHNAACKTYTANGWRNNYYNGAIGDPNFAPHASYASYGFYPHAPITIFPFSIPYIMNSASWPNYPSYIGVPPLIPAVGNKSLYQPNAIIPINTGRGFFDFGCPSSFYHKGRYANKIRRVPDMQTLCNLLAGGATSATGIGNALTLSAQNNVYFATGQCPIYKELELFISTIAKKGTLFNTTAITPLVTEPSFTKNLFDKIVACAGLSGATWHPLGFKPVIIGQKITIKFYDITSGQAYLTNSDIELTNISSTSITNWNNITMFTDITYNGISSSLNTFAINAIYSSGVGQPYSKLLFNGTTCIASNCTPPVAQVCKPTQQAFEIQNFLSAVLADYSSSSPTWVNLGDMTNSSAQFFTSLVRYPYAGATVLFSPVTHQVQLEVAGSNAYKRINIVGNTTTSNIITTTFDFVPIGTVNKPDLQNALGFSAISPRQGTGTFDFTIKAYYTGNVTQDFEVTISYSGGTCGYSTSDYCKKYNVSNCQSYVPTQCDNDLYNTTVQLQSLLNEITAGSNTYNTNTQYSLSGLSNYSPLLQSQIGSSANTFEYNISSTYNSSSTLYDHTVNIIFSKVADGPPVTLCTIVLNFSNPNQINNLAGYSFTGINIIGPPSSNFNIIASDGSNGLNISGSAPCLQMKNCEPCVSSVITFSETFESYTNSTTVPGFNFVNNYVQTSGPVTAGNYAGFNNCVKLFGEYSIYETTAGNTCVGYTNHTPSPSEKFLSACINDGTNPPLSDYFEIWENKNFISATPGKKYDISCYYRSTIKFFPPNNFKIELIANDGTSSYVIASEIVTGTTPPFWKKLGATWTCPTNQFKIKVRTSPIVITSPLVQNSFMTEVSLDDILIKELNCGNGSVYPLPPPVTQTQPCQNQLYNIALSNAQQKYDLYIDNIKKDFSERYNKKCLESLESLKAQYQTREGHYTLYYYDQAGNLIKTIPPEGVEPINLGAIEPISGLTYGAKIKQDRLNKTHTVFTNHRLATRYEYNSLNQLIRQQMPDHENTNIWETPVSSGMPVNVQAGAMDFSDSNRGYIVGNDGTNGVIYITNNGGSSWSPASSLGVGDMIDIDVAGGVNAFAIISDGTILKSPSWNTSVPTWQTINLIGSSSMQFTDIEFADANVGYITGLNGLLLKTTDGGANWSNISLGTTANLNKIKFIASGSSYYGILVGSNGTLFYTTPASFGTWQQYSLINTSIDITNVEIIDVTSFMDVILTAIDKGAAPNKGTAIKVDNVDDNSTTQITSLFTIGGSLNSSLNAITFNKFVSGSNNFTEAYVGGSINSTTPIMYKLKSINTGAFVATPIGVSPVNNNSVTDLKTYNFGTYPYEVYGATQTGQLLILNSGNTSATPYSLYTTGSNVNTSKLNNIWLNPSSSNSGLIAGNNGTLIKFTVSPGPSVVSSNPNVVTYPFLNAVTAAKDGSGKVYAVGNNGAIVKSGNFGASWQNYNASLPAGIDLFSALYLPGTTPLLVVGGNKATIAEIDFSAITPVTLISNSSSSLKQYNSIILDPGTPNKLFISGKDNTNDALIESYYKGNTSISSVFASTSYKSINKLAFASNTSVFAVCDQGSLLHSSTSGTSPYNFVALTPSTSNDLKEINFSDNLNGYIFGTNNTIYKTIDGGLTWAQKTAPLGANINAIYNFGNGQLLAVGNSYPNMFQINDQSSDYSSRFFYDALGRLIISQNVKQFNKPMKAYSYTIYDALGRISEVGEIAGAAMQDPEALKNVNNVIDMNIYNIWLASGIKTEVTFTKYDLPVTSPCSFTQDNLRKRVAATYLDSDDDLSNGYRHATYYTYDIHGNVSSLLQENPLMPAGHTCKRIDYKYDLLSGKVNEVAYQAGEKDAWHHKYEYDSDNRITNVFSSKDGFCWQQDAKYFYYLHGPLARVELGNDKVQGMDYAYTLQGWIKGINSTIINENNDIGKDGATGTLYNSTFADIHKYVTKDAASYGLNYYQNDYSAIDASKNTSVNRFDADVTANPHMSNSNNWLYNGNIAAMATSINEGVAGIKPQLTTYKYDQLNRLNTMIAYRNIGSNAWSGTAGYEYRNEFTYDANGNIETQLRYNDAGVMEDDLNYRYHTDGAAKKYSNRLYHVNDNVSVTANLTDIEDQGVFTPAPSTGSSMGTINSANNYSYDEIGNLIKDSKQDISNIEWTVYGKIKKIDRVLANVVDYNHEFEYDASGNRVSKTIYLNGQSPNQWKTTYYVRDAQGNVMATYQFEPVSSTQKLFLIEHPVYGSSRTGMQTYDETDNLDATSAYITSTPIYSMQQKTGLKYFEISNHLGNVISVVSDKKDPVQGAPTIVDYYKPNIISAIDYYAFGQTMPGRNYQSSTGYRYGFNGKENDNEVKGTGNQQDYGDRTYDPRLGRFLSLDPLSMKFPYWSPYHFAGNTPIQAIDLDGREILFVNGHYQDNWIGRNLLESDKPGKDYWGNGFTEAAQEYFDDYSPVTDNNYINGSSVAAFDKSGADRFTLGRDYAKANLEKITADYVEGQSTFKVVTHSEGAAFGAGIVDYLLEKGYKVSQVVHLSADEGDEFTTPSEPMTLQFGYDGDWVTGNEKIKGTDKFGLADSKDLGWDEVHGTTKSADVFKKVADLKTVQTEKSWDKNGKIINTQSSNSTINNTKFKQVDDKKIK